MQMWTNKYILKNNLKREGGKKEPWKRVCSVSRSHSALNRQNNGSVKAVSPRHCAATISLRNCCFNCRAWQSHKDNVGCTAVEEQPEAKEVQLSQPCSTSLLMVSSGLTWGSSSTSLFMVSSGLTWRSSTSLLLISPETL